MATRLTDAEVRAIRERAAKGELVESLGRDFGRSKSAISHILAGDCYRHAGGPLRRKKPAAPDGMRWCSRCRKFQPEDDFSFGYTRKDGSRSRGGYCRACRRRLNERRAEQRRHGPRQRMPRANAHGDVWCPNCRAYLHPERFTYPPHANGKPSSYCRACSTELSRISFQQVQKTPERYVAMRRQANATQRRNRRRKMDERADFVRRGIETLRARGLTPTDVTDALGVSDGTRRCWEKGRTPDPNAAERMRVLLAATVGWPARPARKPGAPRPAWITQLIAETRDDILAFPLRNRWTAAAVA